jgi:hypothetical protein
VKYVLRAGHDGCVHGDILECVEEAVPDAVMQSGLGEFTVAVEVVVAENVEPAFAFASSPICMNRQSEAPGQGDAEEVWGESVVGL